MAKVRVFKDRRPGLEIRRRTQPYSRPQSQEAEQQDESPTPEEEGVVQAAQQQLQESRSTPSSRRVAVPAQPRQYAITVPNLHEIMARVHAKAGQLGVRSSVLSINSRTASLGYRPLERFSIPANTNTRQLTYSPLQERPMNTVNNFNRGESPIPPPLCVLSQAPTEVQLRGYAGLEDCPILPMMMNHPQFNNLHSFYFRFDDLNCPPAVLLFDPLLPDDKRGLHRDCGFCNGDLCAWLYVRRRGDVKWTRDFQAARGGGRQAVYLSRCEPGYRWEKQIGDLLDCRKNLNLWLKVEN